MSFVINLDEYADVGTRWIALYALNNDIIYFDSFGVEHIPTENKNLIGNKNNIKTNVFRIQGNNSLKCGYFWIGFITFVLACKTLIDYRILFSPCHLGKASSRH